eukprot:CAMPEP_0185856378 /NCGR_PEP_ID=MMETSP1354-20130828/28868_1 /TAXON_ID=708628 /ORGANISM="Erythrolobus madagascarensis, Strain CCMP3276" /LENGTH=102 /DNA_ID=CAMNT_0028558621 /DNA_START=1 /DNA_END=305 /DNA_ORIENTATION=+
MPMHFPHAAFAPDQVANGAVPFMNARGHAQAPHSRAVAHTQIPYPPPPPHELPAASERGPSAAPEDPLSPDGGYNPLAPDLTPPPPMLAGVLPNHHHPPPPP